MTWSGAVANPYSADETESESTPIPESFWDEPMDEKRTSWEQRASTIAPLNILFLCNGHGSMSQRFLCELQAAGHRVSVLLPKNGMIIHFS